MSFEKKFNGKFRGAMNSFIDGQERAAKSRQARPVPAKRRR